MIQNTFRFFLFLYCSFLWNGVISQPKKIKEFEGSLDMKLSYTAKTALGKKLIKGLPTQGKYYYKKGKFIQKYEQGSIAYSIYLGELYEYSKFSSNDTIFARRVDQMDFMDENMEVSKVKNTHKILDYTCHTVMLKNDFQVKLFIFTDAIRTRKLEGFKANNAEEIWKYSASIPLLFISENKHYLMRVEVTKVHFEKIKNSLFKLPKAPVKKVSRMVPQ